MKLSEILSQNCVQLNADATSKKRVLESASEMLAQNDHNLSPRQVFDCLIAREKLGSTGLGHGVAIPHGRLPGLKETIGVFLRIPDGVDFDAPDGLPVDLVFALLVPEDSTDEHLQVLARIASFFDDEKSREALRGEESPEKARELLCRADRQH